MRPSAVAADAVRVRTQLAICVPPTQRARAQLHKARSFIEVPAATLVNSFLRPLKHTRRLQWRLSHAAALSSMTMALGHSAAKANARVSALSLRAQRPRVLARRHKFLAGLSKTDELSLS